ncbi:ABC transporter substrate-binding protein [Aquabacterium sp. J223]|uniref:ABC transporter substrate-binding protein n=1 Tax=Aquabacterium sp. J223 TaxID=2898431 RepID=UPI0021ADF508|nr:ABC transporter substrate-binding protein [Aquabacterium sp. J223]UUX96259.1 ABC transporter substrate-binding protein [Aquabacterium sp. J223]
MNLPSWTRALPALLVGALLAWAAAAGAQPAAPKVLRYAFNAAETGFDPVQTSDVYSRIVTVHIYESLYKYDHLARPYKIKPNTAAAMPEVSDDFRTWTVRIKPGIYYTDDPAFKGRKRELVAEDYVYQFKRVYDPRWNSPAVVSLEDEGIIGLMDLRQKALKEKKPFDYDTPVEGLQAVDRYTLRFKLREPRPRFLYGLAGAEGMAREVVEFYGDRIMEHPVGTGPFVLKEWRRSSRIVLERNPNYREVTYDAEPAADDAEGQALLARFKGRRLPMVDRVEVSIIEQSQPRWLAFLNGEHDFLYGLPNEYAPQAVPNGRIAPNLAKRGIVAHRQPGSDVTVTVYNMENPLIGGNAAAKVALRRALNLAYDVQREIQSVRRGQAVAAQSVMSPNTSGYQPDLVTENSLTDVPRAKALLDLYGWRDRDGDGWRETPDGQPLVLEMLSQSDPNSRQLDELWKKSTDALGVRVAIKVAQWPENLKAVRAGKFMIWRVGSSASSPDGQGSMEFGYGPSAGKGNLARFELPAYDTLYDRLKQLPDGPQRQAAFLEATRLLVAYAPYRFNVHRLVTDLTYAPLVGYRRPLFWYDWWQYVDIDPSLSPR